MASTTSIGISLILMALLIAGMYFYYTSTNPPPTPPPTPGPPPQPIPPSPSTRTVSGVQTSSYNGNGFLRLEGGHQYFGSEYSITFEVRTDQNQGFLFGVNVPNIPNPDFNIFPALFIFLEDKGFVRTYVTAPNPITVHSGLTFVNWTADPSKWYKIEFRLIGKIASRTAQLFINDYLVHQINGIEPYPIPSSDVYLFGRPNFVYRPEIKNFIGCARNIVINGKKDIIFNVEREIKYNTCDT